MLPGSCVRAETGVVEGGKQPLDWQAEKLALEHWHQLYQARESSLVPAGYLTDQFLLNL